MAVLDFGSQTSALIVRRIRDLGVYATLLSPRITCAELRQKRPVAVVLSGGPQSLCDAGAVRCDPEIFTLGIPILGICYGMQLLIEESGGRIEKASSREFGQRAISLVGRSALFQGLTGPITVWMSHTDQASIGSAQLTITAHSDSCPLAAVECVERNFYGVQFHPEVSHSDEGSLIISNFVCSIAKAQPSFDLNDFLQEKIAKIKETVGHERVILGLSGGVDSTVAAVLIKRAIGSKLHCVFVDHGLHREGDVEEIAHLAQSLQLDLHVIDAREQFLSALEGISDPEKKRKIIGHTFIDIFEKEAMRFDDIAFLAQGTLYSDVIESSGRGLGPSETIKSHHNVGALPERMNLRLLEPLDELFKDEVRTLGQLLDLPQALLDRQPFPGPGLSIRIPGLVTGERLTMLRKADAIVRAEIAQAQKNAACPQSVWQWFAILLPVKSVGVMGDGRVYGETIVIRCVDSVDAMTADWSKLSHELLNVISTRITNEVQGISRVLYDITQKPPGTIEWE